MAEAAVKKHEWQSELYSTQDKCFWPWRGRHILAQYDDDTIVVYQAFNAEIADYAVKNQRLGGQHFSYDRMSWIKTNFLWMMYRCGWARKKNQDHVLAIRLPRAKFHEILANAFNSRLLKSKEHGTIKVRLQWDPDHAPSGDRVYRRAIQLGLKGDILRKYGSEWIVQIDDITEFVTEQRHKIFKKNTQKYLKSAEPELLTARERVYPITDPDLIHRLELDVFEGKSHHPDAERDTLVQTQSRISPVVEASGTAITTKQNEPDNINSDETASGGGETTLDNDLGEAHPVEDLDDTCTNETNGDLAHLGIADDNNSNKDLDTRSSTENKSQDDNGRINLSEQNHRPDNMRNIHTGKLTEGESNYEKGFHTTSAVQDGQEPNDIVDRINSLADEDTPDDWTTIET